MVTWIQLKHGTPNYSTVVLQPVLTNMDLDQPSLLALMCLSGCRAQIEWLQYQSSSDLWCAETYSSYILHSWVWVTTPLQNPEHLRGKPGFHPSRHEQLHGSDDHDVTHPVARKMSPQRTIDLAACYMFWGRSGPVPKTWRTSETKTNNGNMSS